MKGFNDVVVQQFLSVDGPHEVNVVEFFIWYFSDYSYVRKLYDCKEDILQQWKLFTTSTLKAQ